MIMCWVWEPGSLVGIRTIRGPRRTNGAAWRGCSYGLCMSARSSTSARKCTAGTGGDLRRYVALPACLVRVCVTIPQTQSAEDVLEDDVRGSATSPVCQFTQGWEWDFSGTSQTRGRRKRGGNYYTNPSRHDGSAVNLKLEKSKRVLGLAGRGDIKEEDVKSAFRQKALLYHPDRCGTLHEHVCYLGAESLSAVSRQGHGPAGKGYRAFQGSQ
jgi:hypothetical protein